WEILLRRGWLLGLAFLVGALGVSLARCFLPPLSRALAQDLGQDLTARSSVRSLALILAILACVTPIVVPGLLAAPLLVRGMGVGESDAWVILAGWLAGLAGALVGLRLAFRKGPLPKAAPDSGKRVMVVPGRARAVTALVLAAL